MYKGNENWKVNAVRDGLIFSTWLIFADSLGGYSIKSMLCVFLFPKVISLEGWVDIMYYIQDAHSFWDWIYFVALIVVRLSNIQT